MSSAQPRGRDGVSEGRLADLVPAIRDHLARHRPRRIAAPTGGEDRGSGCRAAVAFILLEHSFRGTCAPAFLMIKRSPRGPFPGQWALPGGRLAPGEDEVSAAVRETAEEVGADLSVDDLVGTLDDVPTAGSTIITPLVFALDRPVRLHRDPREIHSLHPIRLARLTDPGVPRWRRGLDTIPLLQMPLRHDMIVHAPTGAILWQFAQVALRGVTQDVASLAEPAFLDTEPPTARAATV